MIETSSTRQQQDLRPWAWVIQTFLEATQKFYNADLKAVDFIGAPEDCRVEINNWVEEQLN